MTVINEFLWILWSFSSSFALSTLLIRRGLPWLKSGDIATVFNDHSAAQLPESWSNEIFDLRSTGLWIGFFETLLIFILVYADEYSALAIIIGAKEFVRKEKISDDASYYLLGTLANLCVAVLFALISKNFAIVNSWLVS
ncbi:MAG: hypothetical protein AAGJ73_04780 [Pseudomonadota bacterium]